MAGIRDGNKLHWQTCQRGGARMVVIGQGDRHVVGRAQRFLCLTALKRLQLKAKK